VRPPQSDDGGVAVDDVARDAKSGGLTNEIVDPTQQGSDHAEVVPGWQGAEARIVESQLLGRIDGRIWTTSRRSEEFIDVGPPLIEREATALASTVRVNYNITHSS